MATTASQQLLAQLLQISVNTAKAPSAETRQTLASQLGALFKADRVLVFQRGAKLKLVASDSYADKPPANSYNDQLREAATTLSKSAPEAGVIQAENCWLVLDARHALLLQRPASLVWQQAEFTLLNQVAPLLAATLRPAQGVRKRPLLLAAAAALLLLLPVPDHVVAPAIVESAKADKMFAPLDGVIEKVVAQPGSQVAKGDVLLRYEQRDWLQQRQQALRDKELAVVELERLRAAGWQDSQARAAIPAQELRIAQATQQLAYLDERLAQTELRAEQGGVLQIDNAEDLQGALVRAGQALATVADANQLRLKLYAPVADFGKVAKHDELSFRADARPWSRWGAEVQRLGADVQLSEQQQPSLPVWANFEDQQALELSLGERGTARVSTGWTVLAVVLFRKPWELISDVLPL